MTAQQRIAAAPIRKRFEVEAPLERTFRVFTSRMHDWWPRGHSIVRDGERTDIVIEPREGGRWFERSSTGGEIDWGRVSVFDAPNRVLLIWQLTGEFKFDPDFHTEVEVRFTPDGEGRTIVEFEHRDLDRYADPKVPQMMDQGWGEILEAFAASAAA